MIALYFDGLCEPRNPGGWACWSWIAYADGQRVDEDSGCLGHGPGMTNNVAEYQAAIEALTWAHQHADGASIELCGDSLLVINQVRGQWKCNAEHLQPLRDRMVELVNETGAQLRWIPREENTEADALCWRAYREARGGQQNARGVVSAHRPGQRARANTGGPVDHARAGQRGAQSTPAEAADGAGQAARRQGELLDGEGADRGGQGVRLSDDPVTLYWLLARWAIGQGLISEAQARLIARAGTRKQGYWARHLVDLCAVLAGSCSERSTLQREAISQKDRPLLTRSRGE